MRPLLLQFRAEDGLLCLQRMAQVTMIRKTRCWSTWTVFGIAALLPSCRPLSADFIVLTLSHCISHEQFQGPLASTMRILLGQGYSVTIKTLLVRDSDAYEGQPVLLLAAPRVSNPQWIDDTISDLQIMSNSANGPNGSIETPAVGTETSRPSHLDVKELNLDQPTQGSSIPAPVDAILPAKFVWSEATDVMERNGFPPPPPAAQVDQ